MDPTAPSAAIFRLRGLDDDGLVFDLKLGEQSIGSSRTNTLILPDTSVSRRHARLVVTYETLFIEDLESSNGTYVAGSRFARGTVEAGAELRFGRVRLQVERVRPGDARLAILLPDQPTTTEGSSLASYGPENSTLAIDAEEATRAGVWLHRIDAFLEHLARQPESDLTEALTFLGDSLKLTGCCAVRWHREATPVALAAWGQVGKVPGFLEARRSALGGHQTASAVFLPTEPPAALGVVSRSASEAVGLVLWGHLEASPSHRQGLTTLVRIIERTTPRSIETQTRAPKLPDLIFPRTYRPGRSLPMRALYTQMRQLLQGDLSVLICGETGVGKEAVASTLHRSSVRRDGPFVALNCAAIPAELLESEIFGIGKGVATGVEARRGKFELAQGGTLFLDEIAEMPAALQAKLLRALQEKEIQPLGGSPRALDIWVISATNVDLERQMEIGSLRPDLYYRLAGCLLQVPSLRHCKEDIPGLIEHFLQRFAVKTEARVQGLTVAALDELTAYAWPGNVRELENEIKRLVSMCPASGIIDSEQLADRIHQRRASYASAARYVAELSGLELTPAVEAVETCLIRAALERSGGLKVAASQLLGMSRNGLRKKMRRLGIEPEEDGEVTSDPS